MNMSRPDQVTSKVFRYFVCFAAFSLPLLGCSSSNTTSEPPGLVINESEVSGDLHIVTSSGSEVRQAAIENIASLFVQSYPNVNLRFTQSDEYRDQTVLANLLASDTADIVEVQAGTRMKRLVATNLLMDISDIWTANALNSSMAAVQSAISVSNSQWVGFA